MFRELRRRKQALDKDACVKILVSEKRGAFAVNGDDGYPYAVPMDFYFDPEGMRIYLHSALEGHKVDAIRKNDKVCFTCWNKGEKKPDDWSYYVDSVICFGKASIVSDEGERVHFTRLFGNKYYPSEEDVEVEIERDLSRMLLIRIDIEHMCGKHVHEK